MPQHEGLTLERWRRYPAAHQVIMVANELHRAMSLTRTDDTLRRQNAFERALALTDLTIAAQSGRSLRRELLRFRDLLAAFYLEPSPSTSDQAALLRALLLLTPESALQREPLDLH